MNWKLETSYVGSKGCLERIYLDGKEIPFSREDPLYLRLDKAIRNFDRFKRREITLRWARWLARWIDKQQGESK